MSPYLIAHRIMQHEEAHGRKVIYLCIEFTAEDYKRMDAWFDSMDDDPADWWKKQ